MRVRKLPWRVRLLICSGLLLGTLPNVFAEYIHLPDFFRGFLIGIGIVLEISGLIVMRRMGLSNNCYNGTEAG